MSLPSVSVTGVTKKYGDLIAIDNLSFSVMPSECFGLLGPNGAGKSTMLRILYGRIIADHPNGLDAHSAPDLQPGCDRFGTVNILGFDLRRDLLAIKHITGVVPQEDNLDTELNVTDNLLIYAKFYGFTKKESLARIDRLLEFMELGDKRRVLIRELSGGMRRRLVIARALINDPKLLILDEPTTGLDPQVRLAIWDKLRRLKRDGVTILLTTHYMEEAFDLCDRIVILHKGAKICEGNPKDLLRDSIERFALQISNKPALGALKDLVYGSHLPGGIREVEYGESFVLYSDSVESLNALGNRLKPGEWYLRQSTLEDVFIHATGKRFEEV